MNITMNELFKNKKIWLQNVITPKKHVFKKIGVLGIIFLFGTATFISGFSINSYAASSSTVLPIARGGTGANQAAEALTNLGKVNTISSSSTNDQFPSAKAAYDSILSAKGPNNFYKTLGQAKIEDTVYFLGEVPMENADYHYTNLSVDFLTYRISHWNSWGCIFNSRINITMGISPTTENSKTIKITKYMDACQSSVSTSSELGTFLYKEQRYVGLIMRIPNYGWSLGGGGIWGFSSSSLKINCQTDDDVCIGKILPFSDVSDYTKMSE
ncbi:MAG: hypothetical protein LBT91_01675 [Bifidobacteriaceae bacterium]|jgi:hypothetical protein|nr:hypothetical protein [Bifidobacteriaceae bacterium]